MYRNKILSIEDDELNYEKLEICTTNIYKLVLHISSIRFQQFNGIFKLRLQNGEKLKSIVGLEIDIYFHILDQFVQFKKINCSSFCF